MVSHPCCILVIEDDPTKVRLIQRLLFQTKSNSIAKGLSFTLEVVNTFSDALEKLSDSTFDLILLDLSLPDQQGLQGLSKIRERAPRTPILVKGERDDENTAIKSFQLGADGYLQVQNLDSNLLIYQIRQAIERRQYITRIETQQQQKQQEQEFKELEHLISSSVTSITARMFGVQAVRESVPDIFNEMVQTYGDLLDLALEQKAYKVEHNISERLRVLADKLGFLKASPRDIIDIHTTTLREKNQDVTLAKAQAYVSEGRLMVLELMGYLASFYRKYYIGLSTLNVFSQSADNSHHL